MDIDTLQRTYHEEEAKFQSLWRTIDKASKNLDGLNRSLHLRLKDWKRFRSILGKNVSMLFKHFLSLRGFSGRVTFDHNQHHLDLIVRLL